MRVHVSLQGWRDYRYWKDNDRAILDRLNRIIEDTRRTPFSGLGKPEPLRGQFAGLWSRRIDGEHRFIYDVAGHPGEDQRLEIASCRYHYGAR